MTEAPVLVAEPYYMKIWAGKGTAPRALIPAPQAHRTFYIDDNNANTTTIMYMYNGTTWVEVG